MAMLSEYADLLSIGRESKRHLARREACGGPRTVGLAAATALLGGCALLAAASGAVGAPGPVRSARTGLIARAEAETHRPKYARVGGDIETLWQLPSSRVKGLFFAAHGCCHQAPDYFSEQEPDGWRFAACSRTRSGGCLGLPQELHLRRAALARGYGFVAVSGGSGQGDCWSPAEAPRVRRAIEHVLEAEGLPEGLPVFATGSSSGGLLMTPMALPVAEGGVQNLRCIVPMVSTAESTERKVPTLHVYMTEDSRTASFAHQQYLAIQSKGIRAGEIAAKPISVTAEFLGRCLEADVAARVVDALRQHDLVDSDGKLRQDARQRTWVEPVRRAIMGRSTDTLEGDKSCLSELMKVAWSFHEFTGEWADEIIDFCEGKWEGTLGE
mmetsp:Transcript_108639/g.307102  ORF Transcript_108639/g.307102 Transcript_108639/m.307102 type:complete len:384 (+) Transcript_108639:96-1247(+)